MLGRGCSRRRSNLCSLAVRQPGTPITAPSSPAAGAALSLPNRWSHQGKLSLTRSSHCQFEQTVDLKRFSENQWLSVKGTQWLVSVEALTSEAMRIGVQRVVERRAKIFEDYQYDKLIRLPGI